MTGVCVNSTLFFMWGMIRRVEISEGTECIVSKRVRGKNG